MAEFNFRNLVNWGKMAVLTATVVGAVVVCSLFSACDKKPTEPERPPVVSDTLRYDISSVKDLYQQRPDIAAALAKDNTFVVVDVASLRMTSPGLDSLMTGTSGLIGRDNIEWNWTDILAAAQGVLLRYENQWLKLQEPPLAANPEKWTVTESDLPKFQAKGYGNAVELAPAVTDTLRYDIDSVDGFLGLLSEISEAAAGGNNFVIINFESLGISGAQSRQSGGVRGALAAGVNAIKNARGRSFSENVKAAHGAVKNRGRTKTGGESQLDALADGVDELRAKPNVKLNWANIYPTERGMLISHDGHWVRLDMPALLANPYPWSANAADLELFQAAGQGAAIELVAETITFDINSAAAFLNQLDAMNDAANQQNASVVINVSSIGVAANQLTPLTAGVDGIRNRPNVNLTWADIYPTVRGILFSYEGNWILLQNPPLRANPHKWEVTEQDLALFQNAGYGNAVEVADPEIIIVPFNISSAQDFLNQMAAINSAAVQPNTQVNVNVASIGVSESQLAPLTNGVAGLNQAVNLAWETIYPTTAGILIRYNENWLLLRNPDLARNSANEAWSVTTQDMPLFQSAGQDAAVELVAETFTFDITDAAHFLNLLNSGAINTAANQQNATVVVNVPSIGIASNQLTPLTTGVAGLNQAVNLAWETIYPTTAGILFSYEGNWVLLRSPNLLANPHQWLVTPEDFARFPAEQRDALEVQTREITIDIPSTAEYISRTQAIVDSTNVPYVSRVIVNGTAPFGISAEQMAALTASMATLRPMQNVTLDLQEFYPTTSGIMLGYDNPYVNPWGGPTLAANPQNSSKWAVAAADLDSFQTAGQGGAVEVPTRVVTFDNISSASELINKFPAIADSSNVPYVSQVIVPIGSIGINAEQLTPITNGVYGLNQNVQLNWAQEGIYPTASGILLSYHGNWVMLGKPTSPNLRANPHPWTVSEQDLSLFQNAGQGAAIEVAIPETDTLRYDIASFQDLSNQLTAINNAANQPYTHVIVEFPQNGIGVATGQLADLVGIINDLHSDVEVLNWKIYPAAARIYIRYGTHYEPMQRQPQLVGTPNKWYTHQDDLQSFETAGQGDALALSKLNYSREQDYGFDGQILLRPAAAAADTIVWNGHLADAGNLGIPAGWGRNVVLEIGYNWDLPGGQPAMGNMTGPLLKALHTPDVPTGGNLRADNGAIVTSFGLRDAFDPNQSIGGHPARPMRIDKLGDEGETNWAFNHLRESWGRVGINTHIPHMQSTGTGAHANRIYFEPGGHFIDQEDPMRSRYKTEFFANRGWVFTFGTQNNITLVIEMSKLTLCNQYVGSSNPESVAYQIMQEIFSENNNVELPTLEDVKADINTQNAR